MARRATLIDSLRNVNPNLLVVDAGDWGDLNPDNGQLKSDFIFKMMKRFGTDAVTVGQAELKWGVDHYVELAQGSPVVLTSNLRSRSGGDRPGQEYFVKDLGGVRVGVFSLMEGGLLLSQQLDGSTMEALDVFSEADRITRALQGEGCDIIVLLAQMELAFADSVVRRVPDIDVAVLGYRGGLRSTHSTIGNTIVVRAGNRGQYVGWVDLVVDPDGQVVEYGGRSMMLDTKIKKDPEVLALVGEMKGEVSKVNQEAQVLKQTEYRNQQEVDRYLGADVCARCHKPQYEQWASSGHAKAWKTLVDLGMDSSAECVSCHVTGAGKRTGFEHVDIKPDLSAVQCEACHDMGSLHKVGAEAPKLTAGACTSCHDRENSPDFDFSSYMEKIRHW